MSFIQIVMGLMINSPLFPTLLSQVESGTSVQSGRVEELAIILIILLLVATFVAIFSRRFKVPYVAGLVLAGLAITEFLPGNIGLDSSLVLNLFLPILVFEASINTDITRLRSTIVPISVLAGPGLIVSFCVTGLVVRLGLGLEWIPALLVGVILAVTDTVSVIAVFKEVSVPSRLSTIVNGESLFNDGVALVIFTLLVDVQIMGNFSFIHGLQQLFIVIMGGTLIGVIVGYLSSGLLTRYDDGLTSILLSVAVALGTFQLGHLLEVSGVVAVVVAGLIVGNIGIKQTASASNRIALYSFWEYAGFGVNTFIFLLIGLEINPLTLWNILPAVLLAIFAYQLGRLLSVYPLLAILQWFDRPIPWRWKHVLFLGNIKGSLSMVMALTLPATLEGRSQLIALLFGVVLLSLVGQGLSLPWLVKQLNIQEVSAFRQKIQELQAQLMAAKAAQEELNNLLKAGVLPKSIYEEMRASYQVKIAGAEKQLRDIYNIRPEEGDGGNRGRFDAVLRQVLLAEKSALNDALRKQILSEEIVQNQVNDLDKQLLKLEDD
ncbi:cation:proton antiporter [Laspinema olomoucense]|uniref:Cation:proton antiporter n=1 Tax=Laspinema olomoucense D3b TaxID=2953688 RepID=A0ABT2NFW5_9CYAN|nr:MULTISPECIES: cation:proton antiporter [unclassified Laspinema]MCT7980595.1 cation:proton antiporter [Laspinema sp. D3b]MCT7991134.1 cation:proton antiporter [Laspinema sp. D3a]